MSTLTKFFTLFALIVSFTVAIFAQENVETEEKSQTVTENKHDEADNKVLEDKNTPEKKVEAPTKKKEAAIDSFVGISYIPSAKWSFPSFLNYEQGKMSTDVDRNSFTTYEANVRINKLQTVLGFSALTDKNSFSGKLHDFTGYLALKQMYFRMMRGKISGNATWLQQTATNMPAYFTFSTHLTSYDAVYSFSKIPSQTEEGEDRGIISFGAYVGIGFTQGSIPVVIDTLITAGGKENQRFGVSVYDRGYKMSIYSITFGFDTLTGTILEKKVKPGTILPYGACYDRIGFGPGEISSESIQYAEELNPGRKMIDTTTTVAYLENNSSMGISWVPGFLKGKAILALGYNLFFNSIMPMGGGAETATELGYDASTGMLRHGPEFRLFAIW